MSAMTPELNHAYLLFQQGQYADAAKACRNYIKKHPNNAIANEILGTALYKNNQLEEALTPLTKALSRSPDNAQLLNTYGCVLKDIGQLYEAVDALLRAIAVKPGFASAHFNLALVYLKINNQSGAIVELRKTLSLTADHPTAKTLLAETLYDTKNFAEANVFYRILLENQPNNEAYQERVAWCEFYLGHVDRSIEYLRNLIEINPNSFPLNLLIGNIYYRAKQFPEALAAYQKASALDSNDATALNNIGTTLDELGRYEDARDVLERAITLDPKSISAHVNLSQQYLNTKQIDKAKVTCEIALRLNPESPAANIGMGTILNENNEFLRAGEYFMKALRLDPASFVAWYNYGNALHNLGQYEESAICFENALKIDPSHGDAEYNLGMTYLCLGKLADGWRHYFKRFRFLGPNEKLSVITPGMNFGGKRVCFQRAQGLGDELFYLRFISRIKQQGAFIAYRPGEKLFSLLERVSDIDTLVQPDGNLPDADFYFSIDDLPLILDVDSFDKIAPPLRLDPLPERVTKIRQRLSKSGGKRFVGITWRAGTSESDQKHRRIKVLSKNLDIETFGELIESFEGHFVVLQRKPIASEINYLMERFPNRIIDCSDLNDDLEDMLALLSILDHQFGVSNTNVHLRAATGKGGHVLVPFPPEWRWMRDGDASPWFPAFTVQRQSEIGEWHKSELPVEVS